MKSAMFLVYLFLCFQSPAHAASEGLYNEGTEVTLSVQQAMSLMPWAQNSKSYLKKLLNSTQNLAYLEKRQALINGIRQGALNSAPKNAELSMRYVLNRANLVYKIMRTSTHANEPMAVDAQNRFLELSVRMAISLYQSDLELMKLAKKGETIHNITFDFATRYQNLLGHILQYSLDPKVNYQIQQLRLGLFHWDLFRLRENKSYGELIIGVRQLLKTYPAQSPLNNESATLLKKRLGLEFKKLLTQSFIREITVESKLFYDKIIEGKKYCKEEFCTQDKILTFTSNKLEEYIIVDFLNTNELLIETKDEEKIKSRKVIKRSDIFRLPVCKYSSYCAGNKINTNDEPGVFLEVKAVGENGIIVLKNGKYQFLSYSETNAFRSSGCKDYRCVDDKFYLKSDFKDVLSRKTQYTIAGINDYGIVLATNDKGEFSIHRDVYDITSIANCNDFACLRDSVLIITSEWTIEMEEINDIYLSENLPKYYIYEISGYRKYKLNQQKFYKTHGCLDSFCVDKETTYRYYREDKGININVNIIGVNKNGLALKDATTNNYYRYYFSLDLAQAKMKLK